MTFDKLVLYLHYILILVIVLSPFLLPLSLIKPFILVISAIIIQWYVLNGDCFISYFHRESSSNKGAISTLFEINQIEYIDDRRYNLVLSNGKIVMLPKVIDSKLINFIKNNIDLIDKSANYKKFLDLRNFHHKTIRLK